MRKLNLLLIFSLLLMITIKLQIAYGGPIEDLKPGEWYEIPGSQLGIANVFPNPKPPGYGSIEDVVNAWSGGAYDSKRDRLIVWGGGHNNYGGNEIYTFDINTFKWSRIWGPSQDIPSTGTTCGETYSDGNPRSRHTYDGMEYLPTIDKMWGFGGSLYSGGGCGSRATWLFDFVNSSWQRMADASGSQVTAMSAYDPDSDVVYSLIQNGSLLAFDPKSNVWTTHGGTGTWAEYAPSRTMVYHPPSKLLLVIGGGAEIITFDMSLPSPSAKTFFTTGGQAILDTQGPGAEYNPITGNIVAWTGNDSDVYTLDIKTQVWAKHSPTTTVFPPPNIQARGVYGRWRYVPSKNVFIAVNSIYNNVFIYKLSASADTDTTSPASPTGLAIK